MGLSEMSTRRKTHPLKRRKLVHSEAPVHLASAVPKPLSSIQLPICVTCHRSFTGARRNQLVQCARCSEPTCTICSRTCNGCLPSVPPTPALTASPSSAPETPLRSPYRPASALSANMTNVQDWTAPSAVAGRRRKVRDLDREDEGVGEGLDGREEVLPGCGRTVCQKCAFETPESEITTCLDCAAHYRGSD